MCTHRFPKHEVPENKKELTRQKNKMHNLALSVKTTSSPHNLSGKSSNITRCVPLKMLVILSPDRTRYWCESQASFKVFTCLRKSLALTCCLQVLSNQEKAASSKLIYQTLQKVTDDSHTRLFYPVVLNSSLFKVRLQTKKSNGKMAGEAVSCA